MNQTVVFYASLNQSWLSPVPSVRLCIFFILYCPLFCISQQWSQSAQGCDCLTPSSTLPLTNLPNHRRRCHGVEAGPGTETGCGSETSSGCSDALWLKLSERARIPFLDCHFTSRLVSLALMLPLTWLGSFKVTCCWISSSNHRYLRTLTSPQNHPACVWLEFTGVHWSAGPFASSLCSGCGAVIGFWVFFPFTFTIRRNS